MNQIKELQQLCDKYGCRFIITYDNGFIYIRLEGMVLDNEINQLTLNADFNLGISACIKDLHVFIEIVRRRKNLKIKNAPKIYQCPQCGYDENGMDVHSLTHHRLPAFSLKDAIAKIKKDGHPY